MGNSTIIILIVIGIAVLALSLIDNTSSVGRKNKLKELLSEMYKLKGNCDNHEESVRRDVIIQADTLFSKMMQAKRVNSDGFADNLKELNYLYSRKLYNDIWQYHKLRNRIVHENEVVSSSETKRALQVFISAANKLT